MSVPVTDSDQHRRECEARYWIRHTKGNKTTVDELIGRIERRRGKLAADGLRDEMRRQWQSRMG